LKFGPATIAAPTPEKPRTLQAQGAQPKDKVVV